MIIRALKITADRIAGGGVESPMVFNSPTPERRGQQCRDDCEVLGDVAGYREGGQFPAGDEQLLADAENVDEFSGPESNSTM
nr:hypothetical protein [Pseudarthrobacter sp. NS4]